MTPRCQWSDNPANIRSHMGTANVRSAWASNLGMASASFAPDFAGYIFRRFRRMILENTNSGSKPCAAADFYLANFTGAGEPAPAAIGGSYGLRPPPGLTIPRHDTTQIFWASAPNRYIRLRRPILVRVALRRADRAPASIAKIARRYGFSETRALRFGLSDRFRRDAIGHNVGCVRSRVLDPASAGFA
jgi:hypothetical protein